VAQQLEMKEMAPVSGTESQIINHLSPQPTHIDVICRQCSLPISTVSSALTMLELKGVVRQVGAMQYVLV
jgi:DNA processing protein